MMEDRKTVLCTGAGVIDVLIDCPDSLPQPGTSKTVNQILLSVGGCGANTAIGLAKLGISVNFWGRFGEDGAGYFLRSQLNKLGVGLQYWEQMQTVSTKTTVVLLSPGGDRSFLRTTGGGNAINKQDGLRVDWRNIAHLHIGGCYSLRSLLAEDLATVLKHAKSLGVSTSVDTVWSSEGIWSSILPALPWIDHFLPSLSEARMITGTQDPAPICDWLQSHGAQTIAIKLGDQGTFLAQGKQHTHVRAFAQQVVDTTGAGDAFCAGYIAGLQAGRSVIDAVRWGNAWGAVAISAVGATTALHSRDQLLEKLRQR
jgi:sugar/nucleoside kinase (ribokinase family)